MRRGLWLPVLEENHVQKCSDLLCCVLDVGWLRQKLRALFSGLRLLRQGNAQSQARTAGANLMGVVLNNLNIHSNGDSYYAYSHAGYAHLRE